MKNKKLKDIAFITGSSHSFKSAVLLKLISDRFGYIVVFAQNCGDAIKQADTRLETIRIITS